MSIEGSAKTSFGYNYNLSLKLKAQSIPSLRGKRLKGKGKGVLGKGF